MQFIENSIIGVRAAYLRLSSGSGPDVCLFPMIHVGTSDYYDNVRRRLAKCDVVLFEGVRSFNVKMLTLAYRLAIRRKRLGLVGQREALIIPLLEKRAIHADVSANQFAASWSSIPLRQRVFLLLGAPLYGLWVFFTGTRESIGRRLSTEEVESSRDFDRQEYAPEISEAIGTTRDARLVEEISSALTKFDARTTIGILYGAAHMRVASRLLTDTYKYRVVESEWITVFGYQE